MKFWSWHSTSYVNELRFSISCQCEKMCEVAQFNTGDKVLSGGIFRKRLMTTSSILWENSRRLSTRRNMRFTMVFSNPPGSWNNQKDFSKEREGAIWNSEFSNPFWATDTLSKGKHFEQKKTIWRFIQVTECPNISSGDVVKGLEYIDKYKVSISKIGSEHAGEPGKDGKYRDLTSSMKVLAPNKICTHSYFVVGQFDKLIHADNLLSYLKTRLLRFLVLQSMSSINVSKSGNISAEFLCVFFTWIYTNYAL